MSNVTALRPLAYGGMRMLFDRLAEDWEAIRRDPVYRDNFDRGLLELPRRLPLRTPPLRILDVACGTGLASGVLRTRFPRAQVVGVDIAPRMVELAERLVPGAEFTVCDADELPFPDGSFDLVTTLDGVFSVPEIARVTASGGAVYIAYTNGRVPVRRPLEVLATEARGAGLHPVIDDSTGALWLWAQKP